MYFEKHYSEIGIKLKLYLLGPKGSAIMKMNSRLDRKLKMTQLRDFVSIKHSSGREV